MVRLAPTVRVLGQSFPARRALVQSRQALRSHHRVPLPRPHLVQALVSPAHVAMSDRARAQLMIAHAEERRESVAQ